MDNVEILESAEQMIEEYRGILLLDPFFKLTVELTDLLIPSECITDIHSSLSWIIKIDPKKHSDEYDIRYSIIQALLDVLMEEVSGISKRGIIAKLTTSLCDIFGEELEELSND